MVETLSLNEIREIEDQITVAKNVVKMQTEMPKFLAKESYFGSNAGYETKDGKDYATGGANAVIDSNLGELVSFSNYLKYSSGQCPITLRVTSYFIPSELFTLNLEKQKEYIKQVEKHSEKYKSAYFVLSYEVEGELSERARKNLKTTIEQYNSQFKKLELPYV